MVDRVHRARRQGQQADAVLLPGEDRARAQRRRQAGRGSRILIVGVSYKAGVGDLRESPALKIIELLQERGGDVAYHDPHVPELPQYGLRSVELGGDVRPRRDRHRAPGRRPRRGRGAARRRCSTCAASRARCATPRSSSCRPRAARAATTAGAVRSRATASAASPAAASPHSAPDPLRQRRRRRPAGAAPRRGTTSARPPARAATTGQPGGHRLERGERQDLRVARGDERERGAGAQRGELGGVDAAGEAHVGGPARGAQRAPRPGPSPATTSGTPARGGRRRSRRRRPSPPPGGPRRARTSPAGGARARRRTRAGPTGSRARGRRAARRATRAGRSANALGTTNASAAPASRRCHSARPAA